MFFTVYAMVEALFSSIDGTKCSRAGTERKIPKYYLIEGAERLAAFQKFSNFGNIFGAY
jgi:hypothetical protein